MSSFPEIFKKNYSLNLKPPQKQGGIFSLHIGNQKNYHHVNHRAATAFSKYSHENKPQSRHLVSQDGPKTFRSTRDSFKRQQQSKNQLQADSLRNIFLQNQQQINNLQQTFAITKKDQINLKIQLSELNIRHQQQLDSITKKSAQFFQTIKKLLSDLRRQTGMQIKVNNSQTQKINQQLIQMSQIINDFDVQSNQMRKNVLNKFL